jgi:hypothetical protein
LKRNKTDKEFFGKVWLKTPFFWKNLAKKLGGRPQFNVALPWIPSARAHDSRA